MNENRLMQQVTAIFSFFMVFFYLGLGTYLIFFMELSSLDKAVRILFGSAIIFYGSYRAFRAYVKIKEVFFTKDEDQD